MHDRTAIASLTFDDLGAGDRFPLESHQFTREDVLHFASHYDPQPYHLDDAAAAASPVFERLSASGWHTAVIAAILLDKFWRRTRVEGLAGGGVEEIRWIKPVYPDDIVTGTVEVLRARPSKTRPERGVMTMRLDLHNQQDEPVATMTITGIFARAPRR